MTVYAWMQAGKWGTAACVAIAAAAVAYLRAIERANEEFDWGSP